MARKKTSKRPANRSTKKPVTRQPKSASSTRLALLERLLTALSNVAEIRQETNGDSTGDWAIRWEPDFVSIETDVSISDIVVSALGNPDEPNGATEALSELEWAEHYIRSYQDRQLSKSKDEQLRRETLDSLTDDQKRVLGLR